MKKFILKNGEGVEIGDTLIEKSVIDTHFTKELIIKKIIVDEKTLPELLKTGVLIPVGCAHKANCTCGHCTKSEIPMDITFYIGRIASRLGWKPEKVDKYLLTSVDSVLPAAAFSMILREIAIELDKKYEDHIENSPEIYIISLLDGRIVKANKAHIKNYRNFAAFRTIEDAKIACKIVKPILKGMFRKIK